MVQGAVLQLAAEGEQNKASRVLAQREAELDAGAALGVAAACAIAPCRFP